jgi:hypothetical protein
MHLGSGYGGGNTLILKACSGIIGPQFARDLHGFQRWRDRPVGRWDCPPRKE